MTRLGLAQINIKTYKQLVEIHDAIKMPTPKYGGHGGAEIDELGGLYIRELSLTPDEAVLFAKWLLEFYGD